MLQSKEFKQEHNEPFTRQGSLRRVLPSGHNKENLFGRQNEDLNQMFKAFHQEYSIMAEYKMIQVENVQGVYVIPSYEKSTYWFGVAFVRSGLYENGVFRFTIDLDDNFPDSKHPKVVFQSKVYHPVIDEETNQMNLLGGFPTWSKTDNHIWQVLKYIHWSLHSVHSSSQHATNVEAKNLLATNESLFKRKADRCIELSQSQLFETPAHNDKHYITFEPYSPDLHNSVRETMMKPERSNCSSSGPSWVKQNSFRPLSRYPSMRSESES